LNTVAIMFLMNEHSVWSYGPAKISCFCSLDF